MMNVAGSSAFAFNARLKPGFRLISASPKSPLIRMRHDDDIFVSGKLMVDEAVRSGPALVEGWLVPYLILLAVIVSAVAAALILRERQHRRRREELETRLADLEGILIGLTANPRRSERRVATAPSADSSTTSEEFIPRGPLSTAISILRNDLGPGLPGPDRIDLRATLFVYEKLERPSPRPTSPTTSISRCDRSSEGSRDPSTAHRESSFSRSRCARPSDCSSTRTFGFRRRHGRRFRRSLSLLPSFQGLLSDVAVGDADTAEPQRCLNPARPH